MACYDTVIVRCKAYMLFLIWASLLAYVMNREDGQYQLLHAEMSSIPADFHEHGSSVNCSYTSGRSDIWQIHLMPRRYFECIYHCVPHCTCILDGIKIISNCPYERLSIAQVFYPLGGVHALSWADSGLNRIAPLSFVMFNRTYPLTDLYLHNNNIQHLESGTFTGLKDLQLLIVSYNSLQTLDPYVFAELSSLEYLCVDNNMISELPSHVFDKLQSLLHLYLHNNTIGKLPLDIFISLANLQQLTLSNNKITRLKPNTFRNQQSLHSLTLDGNQLNDLPENIFKKLKELSKLILSKNNLHFIPLSLFNPCDNLKLLDLKENPLLWIEPGALSGLNKTVDLFVTSYATCCFTSVNCNYEIPPSQFLTCRRLLPYNVLRIATWIVSIITIVGNLAVFYTRFRHNQRVNRVQFFLITNLTVSDFFMGSYLLILLSVDTYFTEYFPSHSDSWRKSYLCRITGAISVLSSEASAFFITLIAVDRFLGVKYTFSQYRMGTISSRLVIAVLWFMALALALASFMLSGIDSDIYAVSEVCVGLPISRKLQFYREKDGVGLFSTLDRLEDPDIFYGYKEGGSKASMFFSIATFTVLNLLCFLIVGYCYAAIFIYARQTAQRSGRSTRLNEEINMAIKMSLIVLTDFCCWVPIGVLSCLVQTGLVAVDPVAYAWIATFILPINSSINPLLYTLGSVISNKFKSTITQTTDGRRTP